MYKVLVFVPAANPKFELETRAYCFSFNTNRGAEEAFKFFTKVGCQAQWIMDHDKYTRATAV